MTPLSQSLATAPLATQAVQLYDFHPAPEDTRLEFLQGLRETPKRLSPRFLYDKKGAVLFDAICELPEYYLTRTEMQILRDHRQNIADLLGDGVLIEYGSGSSQKIRILLDAAPDLSTYVGLDISQQHLYESCVALGNAYPQVKTIALCADYMQPITLPDHPNLDCRQRVAFFPGSTIGNMEPSQALILLQNIARLVQFQGGLLIGVDLKKDPKILEPAYDDSQGISAAFALNGLEHLNRILGTNFDRHTFIYQAPYNQNKGRIEMQLVSRIQQSIRLDDSEIVLKAGEPIITEHSYKFSVDEFQALAIAAGWQPKEIWVDADNLFSIHYLVVS